MFRKNVEDSIINYDTSVWINNMNKAVSDTNVVLNLAVSPSLWLLPSNAVILKNRIDGYNNKLRIASENMKFGVNPKVNDVGVKKDPPKKTHQDNYATFHLDTLDNNNVVNSKVNKEENPTSHPDNSDDKEEPIKNDDHNKYLMATFAMSGITAYLITKYII